jgi:NAD(P)-dependent dehydrogenase (short-subunit alcohol dehydrogenase family)
MIPRSYRSPSSSLLGALLDSSVVFSFDRIGFARHHQDFVAGDLEVDLSDQTCLVTGANSGIGKATARGLAQRGARVRLLCRSEERGQAARDELRDETDNPSIELDLVDLSELKSVEAVARAVVAEVESVDVLVHNAGVLPATRIETSEGNELCLATNLLGPMLLTWRLMPSLQRAAQARVIFVSSGGMYGARIETKDPQFLAKPYDGVQAYARAKRGQVILSELLSERFAEGGPVFNSMHPGWAETPAVRSSLPRFHAITRHILRSPEQGADTVLWLAACRRIENESGKFWFDRQAVTTHLRAATRETDAQRQWLWRFLCERCGIDDATT